ncbi:MAG: hypothetical protein LBD89_05380 [Tannerellaceae bacterium]|jgi:hypothetical protein|nr:hypothetical protein [Tannerellaceae bacterium]
MISFVYSFLYLCTKDKDSSTSVLSLTRSPSEAKDILQETFLRVWQMREHVSEALSEKNRVV